jgi:8-oxo-dGTP pyrophosphatase MutT (NUDIX family)
LPAASGEVRVDLSAWSDDRFNKLFSAPPEWQPELTGDRVRLVERPLTPAAVLVPIVVEQSKTAQNYRLLLTERASHLQDHAGQIAFPGGRVDDDDSGPEHTALREALEEIGLESTAVNVIGQLPNYTTGTGYVITPVVALVQPAQNYLAAPDEVATIFEVPLSFLLDPQNHQRRAYQINGSERFFYAMPYQSLTSNSTVAREFFIWGATAAIIRNLYRLMSHAR